MTKSHVVNVNINNNTDFALVYSDDYFQTGGLAEGQSWPAEIQPRSIARGQCCESNGSLAGCSGWVEYTLNGNPLYFCFSNPVAGSNGIELGAQTTAWNAMTGQYTPVNRTIQLGNTWVVAMVSSTGSTTNEAVWNVAACDVTAVIPANIELANVEAVYNAFPTEGRRKYYGNPTAPVGFIQLALSHFKGISRIADKMIFTHTNLPLTSPPDGIFVIGDRIGHGDLGFTDVNLPTLHEGWPHPCASQACGTFMAQGIQQSESGTGAGTSEIQILDARMMQVNQNATVIGTIERPHDGVNGVAMGKETGADGHYIVAAVNASRLTIYRSQSPSLITNGTPTAQFDKVFPVPDFPDSGAGLALITQQGDGAIYLVALNADDLGQNNQMNLYKLDLEAKTCTQVATKAMTIPGMSDTVAALKYYALVIPYPMNMWLVGILLAMGESVLNSSFRWGKGLAITSSSTIEVYATDRNPIPLSDIPVVGSNKDFSLVIWSNSSAPAGTLLLSGANGIWSYDLVKQATPVMLQAAPPVWDLAVIGTTLYLGCGSDLGLWSMDTAGTSAPVSNPMIGNDVFGTIVVDGKIYLAMTEGLWIWDPKTPAPPMPVFSTIGQTFYGMTRVGNTLFLANTAAIGGIFSLNLKSQMLEFLPWTVSAQFNDIAIIDGMMYLTGPDGIWTFDYTASAAPTKIATTAGFGFRSMIASGTNIYLTTDGSDGIYQFDTISQARPTQMANTEQIGFYGIIQI